eukprot:s3111_g11.t1
MKLIWVTVIVAIYLAAICAALHLGAGVNPAVWSLMSATSLARLKEIYSKKNIKVTFLMESCSEGLAFSAEKGAQMLGAP